MSAPFFAHLPKPSLKVGRRCPSKITCLTATLSLRKNSEMRNLNLSPPRWASSRRDRAPKVRLAQENWKTRVPNKWPSDEMDPHWKLEVLFSSVSVEFHSTSVVLLVMGMLWEVKGESSGQESRSTLA